MTHVLRPACEKCRHFTEAGRICAAFEDIPLEIWFNQRLHDKPFRGDGGIRFEHDPSKGPMPKLYTEGVVIKL